jgi:hypothetical protein
MKLQFQFRAIQTDDLNILQLCRSGSRTTQTGLIEVRQLAIVLLPHPDFRNGKFNEGGNKHHETKTDIQHHSGSSIRVPIGGDIRSASSELGLY